MAKKKKVDIAFESQGLVLPLARLLPTKHLKPNIDKSRKFQRILSSVKVLGVIEPVIVYPQNGRDGDYFILDGHLRFRVLTQLGDPEVFCLIATDDEGFTYNHKVSQVSTIQEHFMILEAIKNGVSEEQLALTLNLDIPSIRQKRNLLKGICPEAVDLLKEKRASAATLREFRKAKPMRQIEMAELMIASNNFTTSYAKCLVAATSVDQLAEPDKPKKVDGLNADDMVRIEKELESISQDFRQIEESHGRNVLNLVVGVAYLKKLLDNANIVKYLARKHRDVLEQFQQIVESASLDGDA